MPQNSRITWSAFWILLLIAVIHVLFATVLFLILRVAGFWDLPFEFMFDIFPIISIITQAIVCAFLIFIGLYLGKEVGLGAPLLEGWAKKEDIHEQVISALKISIGLGFVVAGAKFLLDRFIFSAFVPSLLMQWKQMPPGFIWIVPFNQGIGDEISYRLFWMTLLVWIIYKIQKPENKQPTPIGVWIPIIVITLFSAVSTTFLADSPLIKLQFIILSGIGGMIFGWLYWKKGIESAIIAHFTSSVLLVLLTMV